MKKQLLLIIAFFTTTIGNAQTWTQIAAPTAATINDCTFINETTGWLITDNAIFNTTDGGTTWVNQFYPVTPSSTERNFKSIHFINANVGIIACENILSNGYDPQQVSTILWTNNGGIDWQYKNLGTTDFNENDARLVSPTIAYTIGNGGHCKRTMDGGATWTDIYITNPMSVGLKLSVIDEARVFFGGIQNGFIQHGNVGQTSDGGSNWHISNVAPGPVAAIYFVSGNEGWIGAGTGLIKRTVDGGGTWEINTTNIDGMITDIVFTDNTNGWAASDLGQIISTTNQGNDWQLEYQGNSSVNSICMTTPNNVGYAVGADGLILKHAGNLGVNGNTKDVGLSIYPNPATDVVNLELADLPLNGSLVVYNSIGQIVMKMENITESKLTINTQEFANGFYYLQMSQGDKIYKPAKMVIRHD